MRVIAKSLLKRRCVALSSFTRRTDLKSNCRASSAFGTFFWQPQGLRRPLHPRRRSRCNPGFPNGSNREYLSGQSSHPYRRQNLIGLKGIQATGKTRKFYRRSGGVPNPVCHAWLFLMVGSGHHEKHSNFIMLKESRKNVFNIGRL